MKEIRYRAKLSLPVFRRLLLRSSGHYPAETPIFGVEYNHEQVLRSRDHVIQRCGTKGAIGVTADRQADVNA